MSTHILIIDDEPDVFSIFRQRYRQQVRSGEIFFYFSENGQEGLKKIQINQKICLILTDLKMPVMGGLEFLKNLGTIEERLFIPIVVSAYDDMKNIREAMNCGAFDFLTKPYNLDDLDCTLQKAKRHLQLLDEKKKQEKKLNAEIQKKEVALLAKKFQNDFIQEIRSELEVPFQLMKVPLEEAFEISTEWAVRQKLKQAKKNGILVEELIGQFHDLDKFPVEENRFNPSPIDLDFFMDSLIKSFEGITDERKVKISYQVEPHELFWPLDPKLLRRVMFRILAGMFNSEKKLGEILILVEQVESSLQIELKPQKNRFLIVLTMDPLSP